MQRLSNLEEMELSYITNYICIIWLVFFRAIIALPNLSKIKHLEIITSKLRVSNVDSDQLRLQIDSKYKSFDLLLLRNRHLIHPQFHLIHGNTSTQQNIHQTSSNCFYQEHSSNEENIFATFSTCGGSLSGLIIDSEGEQYYLEQLYCDKDKNCTHAFFTVTDDELMQIPIFTSSRTRVRRSNNELKYISLAVVVDKSFNDKYAGDISQTTKAVIEMVNYVDWLYKKINTRCALRSLEIWNDRDKIQVTNDSSVLLNAFKKYNREKLLVEHNYAHDLAHFVTGLSFKDITVGLAPIGTICTSQAASISMLRGSIPMTASVVAHEMGHVLGMYHDASNCVCNSAYCVMNSVASSSVPAAAFTTCNTDNFDALCNEGKCHCLRDIPNDLFGPSVCGNGFHEPGEECDCGSLQECKNPCCNATTCKLTLGSKCASGGCCQDCQIIESGTLCRSLNNECDLPEYCDGMSGMCPEDVYRQDLSPCNTNKNYCFNGVCTDTVDNQCKRFWGENAFKANDICFGNNVFGNIKGNCGTDASGNLVGCAPEDVLCGALQCTGENIPTFPIIGSSRKTSIVRYTVNGETHLCKSGTTYLADNIKDPHVILTGSSCGNNKVCYEKKCQNVTKLRSQFIVLCKDTCLNDGICNNKAYCSCPHGYTGTQCERLSNATINEVSTGETKSKLSIIITPIACGIVLLLVVVVICIKCYKKKFVVKKDLETRNTQTEADNNNGISKSSISRKESDNDETFKEFESNSIESPFTKQFRKISHAINYANLHERRRSSYGLDLKNNNELEEEHINIPDVIKDSLGKTDTQASKTNLSGNNRDLSGSFNYGFSTFNPQSQKKIKISTKNTEIETKKRKKVALGNETEITDTGTKNSGLKLPSIDINKGSLIADKEVNGQLDTSIMQQLDNILGSPDTPTPQFVNSPKNNRQTKSEKNESPGVTNVKVKPSTKKKKRRVSTTIYPTDVLDQKTRDRKRSSHSSSG